MVLTTMSSTGSRMSMGWMMVELSSTDCDEHAMRRVRKRNLRGRAQRHHATVTPQERHEEVLGATWQAQGLDQAQVDARAELA